MALTTDPQTTTYDDALASVEAAYERSLYNAIRYDNEGDGEDDARLARQFRRESDRLEAAIRRLVHRDQARDIIVFRRTRASRAAEGE